MLALKVNSEFVDIDATVSANINIVMPPFDRESFERVYTFPFKLPATSRNKGIFQYNHRLDSRNATQQYPAELWLEGIQFKTGFVTVTNISPTAIEVSFKSASMRIADRLKEIRLNKHLDYEVEVTDAFCPDEIWVADWNSEDPFVEWIFQVNDDIFIRPIAQLEQLVDDINALYPDLAEVYPYDDYGDTIAILIKRPGCTEGVTVVTAVKPDPSYSNFASGGIVIYNEIERIKTDWETHFATLLATPTTHVFPTFRAPNFYNDKNPDWLDYVNYYTTAEAYAFNVDLEDIKRWPYAITPMFFLQEVLDQIGVVLGGYTFAGNFLGDEEVQDLIVYNNRPLDYIIESFLHKFINVYSVSFNIKNHVPDVSAMDFLLDTNSMFCLWFNVDGSVIEVNTIDSLLRSPIEDWTAKADPMYRASIPDNNGYQLDYERQGEEVVTAGQLETVTDGEGGASYKSNWFSLYQADETDTIDGDRLWLIPNTGEQGISEVFNLTLQITKRLLFYRGLQPSDNDGVEVDYPMATFGALDRNGDSTGNYSLEWSGAKGLLATWWQRYIDLTTKGKPVEKIVSLTVKDLVELLTYRSIRKKIYHEHGEMVGVIQSVQIKASINGLSEARVQFIQEPLA